MNGFQKFGTVATLVGVLAGCDSAYKIAEGADSLDVKKHRDIPLTLGVFARVKCKVGDKLQAVETGRFFAFVTPGHEHTLQLPESCSPSKVAQLLKDKGFVEIPHALGTFPKK